MSLWKMGVILILHPVEEIRARKAFRASGSTSLHGSIVHQTSQMASCISMFGGGIAGLGASIVCSVPLSK